MLFVAFIMVNLALVIYIGSKELPAKVFAYATLVAVGWTISMVFITSSPEGSYLGDFLCRFSYTLGFIVALSYSYFCIVFAETRHNFFVKSAYLFLASMFTYILMSTNLFLADSSWYGETPRLHTQIWGTAKHAVFPFVYDVSFVLVFCVGLTYVYAASKKEREKERKVRLTFMFWSLLVGTIPPTLMSVILPSLGINQFDWLSVMSSVLWMSVVAYSIFKVGQLQVKVVVTELLVLALLFILFIAVFV